MGNLNPIIKGLVDDTCKIFDRTPPPDAPRPHGIYLVGGNSHRTEVLAAFRACEYFRKQNIPIECIDAPYRKSNGLYYIDLDHFLKGA